MLTSKFAFSPALAVILAFIPFGCATSQVALTPELRTGPAFARKPARILVGPPTCGSLEYPCPDEYVDTVRAIVQGGLEFQGYSVVDEKQLLITSRQRFETQDTIDRTVKSDGATTHWTLLPSETVTKGETTERTVKKHIELTGSTFEDLPTRERQAVLNEAGADGVVMVRVIVGAQSSVWSQSQDVEVTLKLGVDAGDTMVWAARCVAPSGKFASAKAAVEHATRCAMSALKAPPS